MKNFSFSKKEKLKSNLLIGKLFSNGTSVYAAPVKLFYATLQENSPVHTTKAAFSVPKRNFKRAVARNRIKRLMREAYRLNRTEFFRQHNNSSLLLLFVYTGKEMPAYHDIEPKIILTLQQLRKANEKPA
jgi:ribonuclease P protein component